MIITKKKTNMILQISPWSQAWNFFYFKGNIVILKTKFKKKNTLRPKLSVVLLLKAF